MIKENTLRDFELLLARFYWPRKSISRPKVIASMRKKDNIHTGRILTVSGWLSCKEIFLSNQIFLWLLLKM